MSDYYDNLTEAMTTLGRQPRTLFIGQSMEYAGQAMHKSFAGVPECKKQEMPVAEDFQMGYAIGLALKGFVPICVYPRFDFLLLAANQLVNHLDKLALISDYRPQVIIRTAVGSDKPLDPGPQHKQNHIEAFRMMLKTIPVIDLSVSCLIVPTYMEVFHSCESAVVVEHMELYHANN